MVRNARRIAVILFASLGLFFAAQAVVSQISTPPKPVIAYNQYVDLGVLNTADIVSLRILIANRGNQTLELSRFFATCSCLSIVKEGEQDRIERTEVPPRGTVCLVAKVIVNVIKGSTSFRTAFEFDTTDAEHPHGRVEIVAKIEGSLLAVPRAIEVESFSDKPITESVRVRDTGLSHPFRFRVATSSDPHIVRIAKVTANPDLEDGVVSRQQDLVKLDLEISPLASDRGEASILIFSDSSSDPVLTIPVRVRKPALVRVAPSLVNIPRTSGGEKTYKYSCLCYSPTGKPFDVRVAQAPEGLKVTTRKQEGPNTLIDIEWVEPRVPSRTPKLVKLSATVDGHEADIDLPVFCSEP